MPARSELSPSKYRRLSSPGAALAVDQSKPSKLGFVDSPVRFEHETDPVAPEKRLFRSGTAIGPFAMPGLVTVLKSQSTRS